MLQDHWHITFTKMDKVKSDMIFTDRHKSIISYMKLCDQLFNGYIKNLGWLDVESGMLKYSESGDTDYVFCAIQNEYILLWVPCNDCLNLSLN
jgi:hypothetical protein